MDRAGTLYGIALFSGTEECASKSKPGIYAKVFILLSSTNSNVFNVLTSLIFNF